MRGDDVRQNAMLGYVSLESRVPSTHSLRGINTLLGEALAGMNRHFDRVYASEGCRSIPSERLLKV